MNMLHALFITSLLLLLSACDGLWDPFAPLNPNVCRNGGTDCEKGYVCNQERHVCELFVPKLNAVSPAVFPRTGATPLALSGSGFLSGATITVDGMLADSVNYLSPQRLDTTLPPSPRSFGQIPVLVNNPDGTQVSRNDLFAYYEPRPFQSRTFACPQEGALTSGVAADLNGDGYVDLVVVGTLTYGVVTYLGDGTGKFGSPKFFDLEAFTYLSGIAAGDLNSDGKLDVVVTAEGNAAAFVLLGDGLGSFSSYQLLDTTSRTLGVALGDFNRDSKLDFVLSFDLYSAVGVYYGDGSGTFSALNYQEFPAGGRSTSLAVADA